MKKFISSFSFFIMVLVLLIPNVIFAQDYSLSGPEFDISYHCSNVAKSNVGSLVNHHGTSDQIGNPSGYGGGTLGLTFHLTLQGDNVAGRTLHYSISHPDVATLVPDSGQVTTDGSGNATISTLAPTISANGGTSSSRTLKISGTSESPLEGNITCSVNVTTDGPFNSASTSVGLNQTSYVDLSYNGPVYDPTKEIDLNLSIPISVNYVDQKGHSVSDSKEFEVDVTLSQDRGLIYPGVTLPYNYRFTYYGSPVSMNIPFNIKSTGTFMFDIKLYSYENGVKTFLKEEDRNIFVKQIDSPADIGQNYYVNTSNNKDTSVNFTVYKKNETKPQPEPEKPTTVYVSGITISPSNVSLEVGDSRSLSASVSPNNANEKGVSWSSSNHSVATVDSTGNVKAVGAGTAYITATAKDGHGATGTATVVVKSKTPTVVSPTAIHLSVAAVTLDIGKEYTVNATVEPANANDPSVNWSSSNESIASVKDGHITARGAGSATITAQTSNGKKATCYVTVKKQNETEKVIPVSSITLSVISKTMNIGDSIIVDAIVKPDNATVSEVEWTSNDSKVAVVAGNGKVNAVGAGTATITAHSLDKGKQASCQITVVDNSQKNVKVSSVTVSPTTANITVGSTIDLNDDVQPSNAENRAVSWYSTNDAVATVNEFGIVTGVKVGSCNIVVRTEDGGKSAQCALSVTANEEVQVKPNPGDANPNTPADPGETDEPGIVDPTPEQPEPENPGTDQPTPSDPVNPQPSEPDSPGQTEQPGQAPAAQNIYRLYNSESGEHLYTSDAYEATVLASQSGWKSEDVGWQSPSTGTPVYRLYNAALNDHLYTTDTNEVNVLTTQAGWTADNNGKPIFYSGGDVPIYRLYNSVSLRHHLTKDVNEYNNLPIVSPDWKQEGVAINAIG